MMPKRMSFSLRTLLSLVLMVGAGGALWLRWEAWQVVRVLKTDGEIITGACYSHDARHFATSSFSEQHTAHPKVRLWDRSGRVVLQPKWNEQAPINPYGDIQFVAESRYLRMSIPWRNGSSQLIDMRSHKTLFEDGWAVSHLAFSKGEKRTAAIFEDRGTKNTYVAVYDLENGREIFRIPLELREILSEKRKERAVVRLSPDGAYLAILQERRETEDPYGCRLQLIDIATQKSIVKQFYFPLDGTAHHFDARGSRFVLIHNHAIVVLSANNGESVYSLSDLTEYHLLYDASTEYVTHVLMQKNGFWFSLEMSANELRSVPAPKLEGHSLQTENAWISWQQGSEIRLCNILTGREYAHNPGPYEGAVDPFAGNELNMTLDSDTQHLYFSGNFAAFAFSIEKDQFVPNARYGFVSPDGSREYRAFGDKGRVLAKPSNDIRAEFLDLSAFQRATWASSGNEFFIADRSSITFHGRVRADEPGSLWWEPALWLTVLFAGGFVHSIWLGWRSERARGSV